MSRTLTSAILGSRSFGDGLGKKGTVSDITLYNYTTEGLTVSYVEPTQFPEKFPPLLDALYMGDGRVILVVEALNKDIGETIVTTDQSGARDGIIALSDTVGREELARALKGTVLERYSTVPLSHKEVIQKVSEWPQRDATEGPLVLPLDHAFPVRGVGTVALGLVRRGTVKVHDKLRLYPEEKMVEVRSLQVHDVDVDEARAGQRAGLALKGVEAEEVKRGHILAPVDSMRTGDLLQLSEYTACKFFKGKAGEGDKVHVSVGLDNATAKINTVDGANLTITLSRPMSWVDGERAYVVDLSGSGNRPRIAGSGVIR